MGIRVWGAAEANTDVFVLHARHVVRMCILSVRRTAACAALFASLSVMSRRAPSLAWPGIWPPPHS